MIGTTQQKLTFISLLLLLFLSRLAFGLCSAFWFEDERQVYLIGLKHFTTHQWPYFGPDVTSQIQIPGALQGLLISVPLFALPIPEAPFILLNLLSFSSLCLLAWYSTKRLPEIPRWFVWIWLMTAPWTLNFSTHIVNPSYVLAGAVLFFIGFLELFPYTTKQVISPRLAFFMMGLSFFWIMQLHMSWTVMVPYLAVSLFLQFRNQGKRAFGSLAWLLFGSAITGSLLLPSFFKYGWSGGWGGTGSTATLNLTNLWNILNPVEGVLPRFLSFASFELPRFIGDNSVNRWLFVQQHMWLSPVIFLLLVIGILQPVAMVALWFAKQKRESDWQAIKYLTFGTVLLLCVSFMFSLKAPASHTFYLTLPIAMIYSFHCWSNFLMRPASRKFAALFLIGGIVFHVTLALHNFRTISLYVDRKIPVTAIEKNDYRILGERRFGAHY